MDFVSRYVPVPSGDDLGVRAQAIYDLILGFQPGTGGRWTPDSLIKSETPQAAMYLVTVENRITPEPPASFGEALGSIKSTLGLHVSDLATVLGVSRPTVYSWMQGSEPHSDSRARLAHLFQIASHIKEIGASRPEALVRRPLFDGVSLLDKIKAGEEDLSAYIPRLMAFAEKEKRERLTPKSRSSVAHNLPIEQSVPSYPSE